MKTSLIASYLYDHLVLTFTRKNIYCDIRMENSALLRKSNIFFQFVMFFPLCETTLQGQTPFDVADESVEELLEELLQKQAYVRTCLFLPGIKSILLYLI